MGVIRLDENGKENKEDREYADSFEDDPEYPGRSRKKRKRVGIGGIAEDIIKELPNPKPSRKNPMKNLPNAKPGKPGAPWAKNL